MKSEDPADHSLAREPSSPTERTGKHLTLTIEAGTAAGAVVLHCQGRIIFHRETQALSSIVTEVLPSAQRMIVDLSGIESVDSDALGELVLTHMWAEAAGYTLLFASPRKSVQHLFEATNLLSVFDVYSSVPEAMAAMLPDEPQPA